MTHPASERRTRPTQRDIARRLGVTAAAVGLALNGRPGVSDELRAEVHRVAAELGYRPNYAARAMRTDRSFMMGIVYRNLHNPAFLSLIEGFDETCNARGYTVMVGSSRFDQDREAALIESFAGRGIDGLAVMPVDVDSARRAWRRYGEKPLAFVATPTTVSGNRTFSVRSAEIDSVTLSVAHLAELGHTRIALMTGSLAHPAGVRRSESFVAGARARGVEPVLLPAGWDQAAVRQAVAEYLRQPDRATAIITNSDRLAMAVYEAARDVGIAVPDDLSVIGHDDIDTARLLSPPLTTFAVDHFQMGVRTAEQLISMAEGGPLAEKDIVLPIRLVVRGSTAPPA